MPSFSHPDYTVGTGITPVHAKKLAGCTAGRESHPAPKNMYYINISSVQRCVN